MVRADLLPFPSFQTGLPTAGMVLPAQVGAASSGAAYSPLGQSVARDVQQFIAQGASSAVAGNTAQANWLAIQAARQAQQRSADAPSAAAKVTRPGASKADAANLSAGQQAFLQRIGPWAQQAAQRLGVSVRSVMAHAALESGWGQKPLRTEDGADSLNLFGIKASGQWQGPQLQAMTTEVEDGEVVKKPQAFRQYGDLDASFADYVRLLAHNPRYRAALHTGDDVYAFAQGLAQGGYATDPAYAQKLWAVSQSIPTPP